MHLASNAVPRAGHFARADTDASGYLSMQEFLKAFGSVGGRRAGAFGLLTDRVKAQTLFSFRDYNKDNRLSPAEFEVNPRD